MRQYPQLEIDLSLLQSNARAVISRCNAAGICVCGVIKGADGLPEIARTLHAAGAAELGTSRLEQVAKCRFDDWVLGDKAGLVPPVCPAPGS